MFAVDADEKIKLDQFDSYIEPYIVRITQYEGIFTNHGTGTLIQRDSASYLLSNCHVYCDMEHRTPYDNIFLNRKIIQPSYVAIHYPEDVAIHKLPDLDNAININIFKPTPSISDELFYITGYPSGLMFLDENHGCFSSERVKLIGHDIHIDILDPKYAKNSFFFESDDLYDDCGNDIHGLSGALVWNTKIRECASQGITWTPEKATVAGIVCKWGDKDETQQAMLNTLICTRVDRMCVPDMIDYWNANEAAIISSGIKFFKE